jgi:hypothetical protein
MSIDPTSPHHLFSIQGSYLSPSSTDLPTIFTSTDMRTTRTMITRLVTASQDLPATAKSPASRRKTLVVILDFHASEPSFLKYSRGPMYANHESSWSSKTGSGPGQYPPAESLLPSGEAFRKILDPKVLEVVLKQFQLPLRMFEHRPIPSSAGAQNALGFAAGMKTTQDDLHLVKRTNTNWLRVTEPLDTYSERCAAIG